MEEGSRRLGTIKTRTMTRVVSKIQAIRQNEDKAYEFLSDFRNLDPLIPGDKISSWKSSENQCHFQVTGIGSFGMEISEKEPYKLIKVVSLQNNPMPFTLWIQLKQVEEHDTRVRLTAEASTNPFIRGMVNKYLKQGLDAMIDKLAEYLNPGSAS